MNAKRYRRLTPGFLASFDWKSHEHLTRKAFCTWARRTRKPPIRVSEHSWRRLQRGEPVPTDTIHAFSEFITDHLALGRYALPAISVNADEPTRAANDFVWRGSIWEMGWFKLPSFIGGHFTPPEEQFCANEADLAFAAETIAESVGHHFNPCLSRIEARSLGEQVMQRSWQEHAAYLFRLWKADDRTVLLPTIVDNAGRRCRVAVSVVVPLTSDAYSGFATGSMEDCDIDERHIDVPSRHVLINAVNERMLPDMRVARKKREAAQMITGLFQLASFFPPLYRTGASPVILSFAGTPEQSKRLAGFAFKSRTTFTRLTKSEVFEYTEPSRERLPDQARAFAYAQYESMRAAINLCQYYIQQQNAMMEL